MANVVIAGGGFAGVVAAESLATRLDPEHQITLVSRSDQFIFYPALVRLAFGKCELADVSFDLRQALPSRRVRFIKAEIARVDPAFRRVILGHGEVEGDLSYDYLILALGRRLATERITGYFEYANHLLDVEGALKFGEALRQFNKGRAVLGQCPGARLPVPVYETAFALSRYLTERGVRDSVGITIISPDPPTYQLGDAEVARALRTALETHNVEFLPDFSVDRVTATAVMPESRHGMNYDLLMLLPPFRGPGPVTGLTISQEDGYIGVDETMRVKGAAQMYAAGDCVNLSGPKLGHMAVQQAEVVAANITAEIRGQPPAASYNHEMMLVIDEGSQESIYLHKGLWDDEPATVKQGRFWSWAKRIHEKYWQAMHS